MRREGVVRRAENERALVDFGTGGLDVGVVPPQLAEPDLPIERVLQPGMRVAGVFDKASHWFDIRESRLEEQTALAAYAVGDVVLVRIARVAEAAATAELLPSVTVTLARGDVTPDGSDLRRLLTPGEVVAARVVEREPWRLTLLDVDGEPVPAASIYAGGPPWLLPPAEEEDEPEEAVDEAVVALPAAPAPVVAEPVPAPAPGKPRITPAHMPRRAGERVRPVPPPPVGQPAPAGRRAVEDLSLKVAALRTENAQLAAENARLRDELAGLRYERDQLASLKEASERRTRRLESELTKSRAALRRATSAQPAAAPVFADRERGFRYLVETAWASRIPPGEQHARPLPDYVIGERFLDSVETLHGISVEKVADVVMELLTGLAETSAGRDMHRLRTGPGGDDPVRQRADGAVCWRLALQVNTPSARRLHAWKLPDGRWELASVRKHDDVEP